MAVRQYIGARYVPKFADPIEWQTNTAYEALTIVTYNNNSYTSRKPVPAGIAPTNEVYWAPTGVYNAQVQEYIEIVEGVVDDVDALEDRVDTDEREINKLKIKTNDVYVILADSYGVKSIRGTSWVEYLIQYLNLNAAWNESEVTENTNCIVLARGGQGFVGNETFGNWLQTLQNDFPSSFDKNTVTKFIIGGGYNDQYYAVSAIKEAMDTFNTYMRNNFPNAYAHLFHFGITWGDNIHRTQLINSYTAYSTFDRQRWFYHTGLEGCLDNMQFLDPTDKHHPYGTGGKEVAIRIKQSLMGCIPIESYAVGSITPGAGVTAARTTSLYSRISGLFEELTFPTYNDYTFETAQTASSYNNAAVIGNIGNAYFLTNQAANYLNFTTRCEDGNNNAEVVALAMAVDSDGTVKVWRQGSSSLANLKVVRIPSISFKKFLYNF